MDRRADIATQLSLMRWTMRGFIVTGHWKAMGVAIGVRFVHAVPKGWSTIGMKLLRIMMRLIGRSCIKRS